MTYRVSDSVIQVDSGSPSIEHEAHVWAVCADQQGGREVAWFLYKLDAEAWTAYANEFWVASDDQPAPQAPDGAS